MIRRLISSFVFNELPIGLPGVFIAAVLAAAMSTIAAELNSLATSSVIDVYRRVRERGPVAAARQMDSAVAGVVGREADDVGVVRA